MYIRQSVFYEELTPTEFRARIADSPVAYLPLGTLEWHGEHLPLGSDGIQSRGFFAELAKKIGGIVLPMLFLGPDRVEIRDGRDYYGMDTAIKEGEHVPLQLDGSAYWIEDELFADLLKTTLKQLKRAGFRVVVAHGHGPSTACFSKHINEWEKEYGLKLFHCWGGEDSKYGIQTDHAGANETSLVMYLRPELVHMEYLSTDPNEFPIAVGGEDPRYHASSERGNKSVTIQTERMGKLITEALAE